MTPVRSQPPARRAGGPSVDGLAGLRRCIVLRSGGRVEQSLLDAMAQRSMRATVVRHEPEVMLELMHITADASVGLVIVDPSTRPSLPELLQAIDLYHPATPIWSYEAPTPGTRRLLAILRTPSTPLHHDADAPVSALQTPCQPSLPAPEHSPNAPLRIGSRRPRLPVDALVAARVKADPRRATPAPLASSPRLQAHSRDHDDGPLITPEELAMLLNTKPSA